MLKTIFPARPKPISIPVVNRNNYVDANLTGSLSAITIPIVHTGSSNVKKQNGDSTVVNRNNYVNANLTGSLSAIVVPTIHSGSSKVKTQNGDSVVVNRNNYINSNLTGSLSSIIVPTIHSGSSRVKKQNGDSVVVNRNNYVNANLTGSLSAITIPVVYTGSSKTRQQSSQPTVINLKPITDLFQQQIFQYGGEYILKRISYFNSSSNQLIITSSTLDYGTDAVSPDNFEILYNGIHIPGLYTVEQSGSNVVVTMQKQYIQYDLLVSGTTEINIYGKFK
jgi:hypothetical protein